MSEELKKIGIIFQETELIEKYYLTLKGIFITTFKRSSNGLILDLDSLPTSPFNFKEIFIKWMIEINLSRIKLGQDPLMTMSLALHCPLWKLIDPPIKNLNLTKDGLFGKPSNKSKTKPGTISQKKASPKSINK